MGKATIVVGQSEKHTLQASASAMSRRLEVLVDSQPVLSQVVPFGQGAKLQVGENEKHEIELKIGSWWKLQIWVDGTRTV